VPIFRRWRFPPKPDVEPGPSFMKCQRFSRRRKEELTQPSTLDGCATQSGDPYFSNPTASPTLSRESVLRGNPFRNARPLCAGDLECLTYCHALYDSHYERPRGPSFSNSPVPPPALSCLKAHLPDGALPFIQSAGVCASFGIRPSWNNHPHRIT